MCLCRTSLDPCAHCLVVAKHTTGHPNLDVNKIASAVCQDAFASKQHQFSIASLLPSESVVVVMVQAKVLYHIIEAN